MTNEKIYFYDDNDKVYLDVYICDMHEEYSIKKRPMMLICPGGAYAYCSPREAEPIARAYMADGFNAAILYYSCSRNTDTLYDAKRGISKPHFEVAKSICIIRDNAERWDVDPEQIAVIGFSAGGHLAGCASILWNDENILRALGCREGYNKPNAALLAYPVITSGDKAHKGSFVNLLGKDADEGLLEKYSLEKQVKAGNPPTFVFHTAADTGVPVENTTMLGTAFANAGVPFEMHIFPDGPHGISLATSEVRPNRENYQARWYSWSLMWLQNIFNY